MPGDGGLDWAWLMARRHRLVPPKPFNNGRHAAYGLFLSLAGWKQRQISPDPIYIAENTWAKILKVSKSCIGNYRRLAVQQGLLELVEEHSFQCGADDNRAGRYQFALEQYSILRDWK